MVSHSGGGDGKGREEEIESVQIGLLRSIRKSARGKKLTRLRREVTGKRRAAADRRRTDVVCDGKRMGPVAAPCASPD